MRLYDLRVTVEADRRPLGLRARGGRLLRGDRVEPGSHSGGKHFCLYAIQAVQPLLPAKMRRLPGEDWLERDSLVACPDPDERLVMRIERIGERDARHRGADVAASSASASGTNQAPDEYEALARRAEARPASTCSPSTTTSSTSPRSGRCCSWLG